MRQTGWSPPPGERRKHARNAGGGAAEESAGGESTPARPPARSPLDNPLLRLGAAMPSTLAVQLFNALIGLGSISTAWQLGGRYPLAWTLLLPGLAYAVFAYFCAARSPVVHTMALVVDSLAVVLLMLGGMYFVYGWTAGRGWGFAPYLLAALLPAGLYLPAFRQSMAVIGAPRTPKEEEIEPDPGWDEGDGR